ncbi:hypothetical protein [Microbacterium hydrocarbonoxydans]|uniref:hypothetical protein n=1 Tax=Microbacterium hydrocarbonoxydans TaxID=273678 RepID=UPI00203DEA72|nr:hypothetical protein [Microbacterium hydrocarbonoxydans]MCM3781049.1 hypothetical protein [Microbacterium hydrocarbonoxydans]
MSLPAAARPRTVERESPARAPRRQLQPVTSAPRRRKPKLAYALVALAGAMAIGAAQIGLSLAITQDSFLLASLTSQQHDLDLRTDALQEDLTGLSSPQALATGAASLGMVVAGTPSYLRLSDGAIFGQGTGAGGMSTIDPNGAGAVGNALLQAPVTETATDDAASDAAAGQTQQELPPAITDGLPSPTTR